MQACPQQTAIDFTKALQKIRYAGLSYDFVDKTTKEEDSVSDSQAASLRTPATNKICSAVCVMHQSIPSTNIPPPLGLTPGEFFKVVKFPAPGQKNIDKNPALEDNFVDLQDNFAMILKPFAFFWYSSLAWLSSSFFKDYKACEYKISQ